MSRNSTTGLYTRVDNSFSNPVVGTTISPIDADTYFDDIDSSMNSFIATSASSVAIGTGAKTFTVAADVAGKAFLAGTFIHVWSRADVADFMFGTVTSYSTSTGALVLDIVTTGGSGTNTDWNIMQAGARGATGTTGSQGNAAGFKYSFNTATSGDPGSGKFLFNHATFASATEMNISETDGDANGLAALLATLDDSTSTNKCLAFFQKENDTEGFLAYITGTLTDNGTYDTFSITPITALGTMANNDICRLIPIRTGDKGTDGAGTGDVVGPASSTADSLARFNGTTGKLLKNGAVIGTDVQAFDAQLFSNIPINSQTAAYPIVLADGGKCIYHPSSDNNARTFTIPANGTIALPVGTAITFVNEINVVTIAITSDTLTLAGTGSTGSRSLAANGIATAIKVTTTKWVISGTGLT